MQFQIGGECGQEWNLGVRVSHSQTSNPETPAPRGTSYFITVLLLMKGTVCHKSSVSLVLSLYVLVMFIFWPGKYCFYPFYHL